MPRRTAADRLAILKAAGTALYAAFALAEPFAVAYVAFRVTFG